MIEGQQLQHLNAQELQQVGMASSTDLGYRVEMVRRMSVAHNAEHALLFDDVANAVPAELRKLLHGLPGYERALYPSLMIATGFKEGATLLMAAPPNPVELSHLKRSRQMLERQLQRPVPYNVAYEVNGTPINLLEVNPRDYQRLCQQYAAEMNDPENIARYSANFHTEQFLKHEDKLVSPNRTLVIPFQTTPDHKDQLKPSLEKGDIELPDVAIIDKARNNLLLKENGFPHLPELYVITNDGRIIDNYRDFDDFSKQHKEVFATPENIATYAQNVVAAIDRLGKKGRKAYVKLDSTGASGLGNLDPGDHAIVYDWRVDPKVRTEAVINAFNSMHIEHLPSSAVVEEFVKAGTVEGITQDYTPCGQMVDGVFFPTSINPVGTTKGSYDRQWTAPQAADIGEKQSDWDGLFQVYSEMGDILAKHGYRNGILAGDAFIRAEGGFAQHDYNFRRGGRSTPEAMTVIDPQGWFEALVEIPLDGDVHSSDIFDRYTSVCSSLYDQGILPFSTGLGYFGRQDGECFMKFRLMVPMDYFYNHPEGYSPRSKQLEVVRSHVNRLATR